TFGFYAVVLNERSSFMPCYSKDSQEYQIGAMVLNKCLRLVLRYSKNIYSFFHTLFPQDSLFPQEYRLGAIALNR
ncbi:12426_t:CDS:2, partial [Dentiscutata heterogama]